MATDFNAAAWAEINTPKASTRNFNADFVEAEETLAGMRRGLSNNEAMIGGMQARQTRLDPMFELKKSQATLNIAQAAQQLQEGILSSQIKKRQIDDEAADTLAFSQLAGLQTWEEKSAALSQIIPKSARGIQQANQMRLQLAQLRTSDWTSRAMLSIAQKNPGLAFRLSKMDQDSPEFYEALREADATKNDPGELTGVEVVMPDGSTVQAIRNTQGKGYTVIPNKGDAETVISEKETARKISRLETDARDFENKYVSANADYVEEMAGKKTESEEARGHKARADYFKEQQRKKLQDIEALRSPSAVAPLSSKVAEANKISAENPSWTREQVIEEVNKRFTR